jgi:hypothetical protein
MLAVLILSGKLSPQPEAGATGHLPVLQIAWCAYGIAVLDRSVPLRTRAGHKTERQIVKHKKQSPWRSQGLFIQREPSVPEFVSAGSREN